MGNHDSRDFQEMTIKYKGRIKDFPVEIVEAMLDEQVRQGNKRDVTVFEEDPSSGFLMGGFNWDRSKERGEFWLEIIDNKDFNVFFEKYPKQVREIIGYEIIKPEYAEAAAKIVSERISSTELLDILAESNNYYAQRLHEAGVLDLWFKPIYKEEPNDTDSEAKKVTAMNIPQEISENIEFNFDWDCAPLSKIKSDIEKLEKLGATHIEIEAREEYDSIYLSMEAKRARLETGQEASNRIENQARPAQQNIEKAMRQIEKLKKEFNILKNKHYEIQRRTNKSGKRW